VEKDAAMPDERILVADDESDVLDMCVRALSLECYQVYGVHNGFEAHRDGQEARV